MVFLREHVEGYRPVRSWIWGRSVRLCQAMKIIRRALMGFRRNAHVRNDGESRGKACGVLEGEAWRFTILSTRGEG